VITLKVSAIITEYNPLHNGHVYHIKKTKELSRCDALICVMSGNFAQRGIPTVIDKWTRTKMALLNGVDLVIELPVIYSISSAEFFAFGAVSLLNNLQIVNDICFGSESGNINLLSLIGKVLSDEPVKLKTLLKNYLNKGEVYPLARSKAFKEYFFENFKDNFSYRKISDEELNLTLNSSNNILGIEYCKSLSKLNSKIQPITIKREGANYNTDNLHHVYSSATSIRKYLKENKNIQDLKNHLPQNTFNIIKDLKSKQYQFTYSESMLPYLKHKALTDRNSLVNLPDVSEGIHNKIIKSLCTLNSYEEIIESIKSKRYTYTRINRILCQYFIGFDKYITNQLRGLETPYARILGFNSTGKKVLKELKKKSQIPIYIKIPKHAKNILNLDIQATKAYSLLNKNIAYNSDYLTTPIIID
jgi:predicted nucleotidyltransferase